MLYIALVGFVVLSALLKIQIFSGGVVEVSPIFTLMEHADKNKLTMIFNALIFAPLFEEYIFRRCLVGYLKKNGVPFWGSVLLSTFCFSIIHTGWQQQLSVVSLGIMFGATYYLTEKLWPCILAHFANNFFVWSLMFCPHWYKSDTADIILNSAQPAILGTLACLFIYVNHTSRLKP